mgnify:FL=1
MNINLVRGAAALGQSKESTWGARAQAVAKETGQELAIITAQNMAKKALVNTKVGAYINSLNSDIDLTQLTGEQNSAVSNYLVENKQKYAEYATQIAKIDDPSSGMYMELRDKMNGIQSSFRNLAGQMGTYKQEKIAYLKDFDDQRLSDGNKLGALKNAGDIFTDQGIMGIGEGGNLNFWNEGDGKYSNYASIEKPFLKDFASADKILQLNESVYSAGKSLSGARQNMVRNKLKNMINSGGRDTLLSLASDDFLIEGGLNLEDPSLFEPANEDLLREQVLDSYMNAMVDSAAQGAAEKRPANSGSGRKGSKTGFSGALNDEIDLSGPVINKAMGFSELANETPGINKNNNIVNQINAIDPTSKSNPYISRDRMLARWAAGNNYDSDEMEEADVEFTKEYGNAQIFKFNASNPADSYGTNIDVNNPQALYEFYIQNSGFSGKAQNYHLGQYETYSGRGQKQEQNNEEVIVKEEKVESTGNFG